MASSMDILILPRFADDRAATFSDSLRDDLIRNGNRVRICRKDIADPRILLFNPEKIPDLLVVVGGDGTILLATQRMPVQIPILGINYGEVGFLADIEPENASSFILGLSKPLPIETRMRIEFRLNGKIIGNALNEALIVTERPAKMLKFSIFINGNIAERFRSDGLIISTPTGSTAYAMSAGGPIVDPRVEGFLMVPLAPFMLSNRPHLIDSSRIVCVSLEGVKPVKLVIDGQNEIHLDESCKIELSKSPTPAQFIDAGQNFFEKINHKLRHL